MEVKPSLCQHKLLMAEQKQAAMSNLMGHVREKHVLG